MPDAVTWQLKEKVWYGSKEVTTDIGAHQGDYRQGGYRGFLPIETLGAGDPRVKVSAFLAEIRRHFA